MSSDSLTQVTFACGTNDWMVSEVTIELISFLVGVFSIFDTDLYF